MSRIRPHCPMKPKECQDLIREYAMVNISQGIQHSYQYVGRSMETSTCNM